MSESSIIKSINFEDGSIVELIDADCISGNVAENLIRRRGGAILWRAKPPGVPDYFVDIRLKGLSLFANTFSGQLAEIDFDTGDIVGCHFVK